MDPKDVMYKMTLAAMKEVFDPNVAQGLIKLMQAGEPAQAVAHAADTILQDIATKSKGQGVPFEAYLALAPTVVAFVMQLGTAAKIFKDPAIAQQAVQLLQQEMTRDDQGGPDAEPDAQDQQEQPPAGASAQPGGLLTSPAPATLQ